MKAIIYEKYGNADVLKLKEVATPEINDEEILIRISSFAVNSADVKLRKAKPFVVRAFNGFLKPKNQILGSSFSGKVVLKGKNVNKFKIGDEIFAYENFGAYSEYKKINQNSMILKKPENISLEEISAISFGALSALYFLEDIDVNKHKNILIIGASGSVGINSLQILKSKGFNVDVVANSRSRDILEEFGYNKFYDYKAGISKINQKYDVVFDCSAYYSFLNVKDLINDNGRFITTKFSIGLLAQKFIYKNKYKIKFGVAKERISYLKEISNMIENNKLKAVIDKRFEFKDTNLAHKYFEENSKLGSILISIN